MVIYTVGFPSGSMVAALRRLVMLAWGEACLPLERHRPGRLADRRLPESNLPCALHPHPMSRDLAIAHGRPASAPTAVTLPALSAFHPLALFLASPDAYLLEQEAIDPRPVAPP